MTDTPDKEPVNSVPADHNSEEKHQDPSPVLSPEFQIPHSATNAHQTEQKRKNGIEW